MQITKRNVELRVDDSLMRVYLAAPKTTGKYPGILFYSDIYQLGGPITRLADRVAGYGYVVAAPEIFHRLEPVGSVIEPDDLGRMRGNDDARRTEIREYDADTTAVIEFLKSESTVIPEKIASMGFCIGGHLAFRAALQKDIKAAVCCYPTGIHSGKLGKGIADTQQRMKEIKGKVLMIFGSFDPHVPQEGRTVIAKSLQEAGVSHQILIYEADHTFMRDDGHRYDPAAADLAWTEITTFLQRVLN
ncbi:dienelactone hydrolase family protein [Gloeothece verrucosa]|uniref:Carboxymethylenebutenolidase n=1 Tax=Gloeothece verrucosa (strain PCC 7822) TaxID=497965 RepID=E0UHV0_GLOV7|nr:dienelactone hydrolase family protein [Gloeothece verrucosa]ADN14480.1 Carboxymethylenebutenolidase [Gloeothece verrucosa PCC 7822]